MPSVRECAKANLLKARRKPGDMYGGTNLSEAAGLSPETLDGPELTHAPRNESEDKKQKEWVSDRQLHVRCAVTCEWPAAGRP